MDPLDFGPATTTMARLVTGVTDDQLTARTPCPDYTVADLADHIGGLAFAFTASARKGDVPGGGGSGDGSRLEDGWRERIVAQLAELAEAWRDPAAYDGITMAGPLEMPAEVAALVALDEVVVHGWDLARSTGQRLRGRRRGRGRMPGVRRVLRSSGGRRRRTVRPTGPGPRRRRRARPADRRHRTRPLLDPVIDFGPPGRLR